MALPSSTVKIQSMKAIVIPRLGGPEVLELQDMPTPTPTAGETLVRVQAAGINFADIMTTQGGYPGAPKPPLIAGREFCGVAEGSGKRVMGYAQWGAFAEYIAVKPDLLWEIPAQWSAEQGAAFPVNYFTAYFAYWKAGLLNAPGSRVLIHAVAGGVGTAAVQIGKILGVEMYGTSSSEEKLSRVKELGLQHGINYKDRDYEDAIKEVTQGSGVDAAFEMLGGEHTNKSIRCLRDFGRVIVYGAASGQPSTVDPRLLYSRGTSVHGLWLTYLSRNRSLMDQAWKQLSAWANEGKLHPVVGSVISWTHASQAYRLLLDRKNFGKVVLRIL
jgi:NADPH:quinone reductase